MNDEKETMLFQKLMDMAEDVSTVKAKLDDGLTEEVRGNGVKLEKIEKSMMTKAKCSEIREANVKRKRSRWLVAKDIVLILISFSAMTAAYIAFFVGR